MTNLRLAAAVAVLTGVMAVPAALAGATGRAWVWPLQPAPSISATFAPPDQDWHSGHRGVDLIGAAGQPVLAIGAGHVTFAGRLADRGVVVVDHGGLRSTYEPVVAHIVIGDHVQAGEPVGVLQAVGSHCAPEVCLHLGVKRGDAYLDPLDLLPRLEVRLKPLDGELWAAGPTRAPPDTSPSWAARAQARSSSDGGNVLSARSVLGGAAAVTAAWLAGERRRRRRPHARG
jgi:hypothetical protein